MNKFLREINGLISKCEAKLLRKAVALLLKSDKYDDFFWTELLSASRSNSNVLYLDANKQYAVCKCKEISTELVCNIAEVQR